MATTATLAADTRAVLDAITDLTDEVFAVVDRIADLARTSLTEADVPRKATLSPIAPVASDAVARGGEHVQGAGFVAAVGFLADEAWWLEWFTEGEDGRAHRLVCQTDPGGIGFYDYEHLPWYVVPRDTGARHVTGPYVDYLCTEDYTMTFTVPVVVPAESGGRFAGVAGADLAVRTAEDLLLPSLRAASRRLAVVNAFGRIVASNSGRHVCGDLVDDVDVRAAWAPAPAYLHRVGDLPLAVLELDHR